MEPLSPVEKKSVELGLRTFELVAQEYALIFLADMWSVNNILGGKLKTAINSKNAGIV